MNSTKSTAVGRLIALVIITLIISGYPPSEAALGQGGITLPDTASLGVPGEIMPGSARSDHLRGGAYLDQTITYEPGRGAVVTNPDSYLVVINKVRSLPEGYRPDDLVYPEVPFNFSERIEKRMMRRGAARALEELFAAAEADDIELVGISAFRSEERQRTIFRRQVERRGESAAARVSAPAGRSEHQTGLAIDISSPSVGFALVTGFGDTREGRWLAENAPHFGFIIRYPAGREERTGYIYEPWHIRYIGVEIAHEIASREITLEDYFAGPPESV